MALIPKIPEKLSVSMLQDLLQLLFNEKIVDEREGNLLFLTLSSPVLTDLQRAILFTTLVHGFDKLY